MHYIKRSSSGITIGLSDETKTVSIGLRAYLEQLCNDVLTTMDGRMHALRKQLALKYHVPLYINRRVALYTTHPLRHMDTVCINYYEVLSIDPHTHNQSCVVFKDLSCLVVDVSRERLSKKHEKTGRILANIAKIVSA